MTAVLEPEVIVTLPEPARDCQELDAAGLVLERAANIIKQRGWCQGAFTDSYGRVCAVGALRLAAGGSITTGLTSIQIEVVLAAAIRLLKLVDAGETNLAWWNDISGRTKEAVITAMQCAARLKE